MKLKSVKAKAFSALSLEARLHFNLEHSKNDDEKLFHYISYVDQVSSPKSFDLELDEDQEENLQIAMSIISAYIENDVVSPDATLNELPAISHAINCPEIIKWLLAKGANPNLGSQNGYTPLHWIAFHWNSYHTRSLLLSAELIASKGGDLNALSNDWQKPIDLIDKITGLASEYRRQTFVDQFNEKTKNPRVFEDIIIPPTQKNTNLISIPLSELDRMDLKLYEELCQQNRSLFSDTFVLNFEDKRFLVVGKGARPAYYTSDISILEESRKKSSKLKKTIYSEIQLDSKPHSEQKMVDILPKRDLSEDGCKFGQRSDLTGDRCITIKSTSVTLYHELEFEPEPEQKTVNSNALSTVGLFSQLDSSESKNNRTKEQALSF